MSNPQDVANQFVNFYYTSFDENRANLAPLYRDMSTLTFENAESIGTGAIIEKLAGLPFGKVQHRVDTLDAQACSPDGGIMVLVTGALMVEGQERPMSYTQAFHLRPEAGTYFVLNDIFKLIYAAS